MYERIVIIGASGSIGSALIRVLAENQPQSHIYAFSRSIPKDTIPSVTYGNIDYENEASIKEAANLASSAGKLDLVLVATGVLHTPEHMPEKSLNDLSAEYCQTLFSANTILPALIGKHFIPHLSNDKPSCFATLTARVGSITDNRKGGWYAYRASKAALNMLIKTFAIETQRTNPQSMIVGLHPGTVDSPLSKPFHTFIDPEKIFDPIDAATKLLSVLHTLTSEHTGKAYAWDGQEIPP